MHVCNPSLQEVEAGELGILVAFDSDSKTEPEQKDDLVSWHT